MERHTIELISTDFQDKNYYTNIRRALLTGFFMCVAMKDGSKNSYHTIKDDQPVLIHPSSVLKADHDWVVYNEFVLTSKQYIRTITAIRPEWLLEIAPVYYDLDTFEKSEVKTALSRVHERIRRKQAYKAKP